MAHRRLPRFIAALILALAGLSAAGFAWAFADLPSIDALPERLRTPSIRITDRHGRLLYDVLDHDGGRHTVLPLEEIPLALRQATVATEDNTFYTNPGVDLRGIVRALWINLRGGETLAGGSTITQQVTRELLLEAGERQERTLRRKLRESLLAWRLARRLSKDEILALYLNQTYYGGLAYGVEAAAQTYFARSVRELDLAQCALLAGLPQAPARYDPLTDPAAAKARQEVVLDLMVKGGMITPEGRDLAAREKLLYAASPYPIEAPHFALWVREQLSEILPPDVVYASGGLAVRTTLDLDWQRHAERIVVGQLEALNDPPGGGLGHRAGNAALVALDPGTGEILAMVGSPGYFDAAVDGAINMALAPRQPGSALKPLVYAAAMDPARPRPWTAATMILDVHTAFVTHDGYAYAPVDFDHRERGPVSLRQALGSSLNIPAVRALDDVGLEALLDLAGRLGITTFGDPDRYDLSLALGGGEVRLLELTAAYAAFANGGTRVVPSAILEVEDARGRTVYRAEPPDRLQVLDPRLAWLITDILGDNDARRPAFGAASALRLDRPAAAKTGTTTDFRDNWTVGYTPELVVGVWVGNADNRPMFDVTGLSGAAPIWHRFVRTVLAGRAETDFPRPQGLVQVEVCAVSGGLPTGDCPYRRAEWFIEGTEPTEHDRLYRRATVDARTGCLADPGTPPADRVSEIALDLPPEAHRWARAQGLTLWGDLACEAAQADGLGGGSEAPLRLTAPDPETVYLLSPNLPASEQGIRIEAAGEAGLRQVTLWLDGAPLAGFEGPPYWAWWPLAPGRHRAWAEALRATGERVASERIEFEVLDERLDPW